MNRRRLLIFFIIYSSIILLINNYLPSFVLANFQLILVIVFTVHLGIKGGLITAVYSTVIMLLKSMQTPDNFFDIQMIIGILVYYIIALVLGKVIDLIRFNRDELQKEIKRRKEVEDTLRKNKEKIEGLHKTALEMESCQNEDEIYQLTVNAAERILDFDVCSIDIVRDEKFIIKALSSGVTEDGTVAGSIYEGLGGKSYRNEVSYLTKDVREDSDANPAKSEYRSALTVPVEKFGIFQVVSTEVDYFTEEDLELAELLVAHTSAALNRLKAEKKIRYLGFYDELTGLYNRSYFEQELRRLDTQRQLPLSLIMGDLNSLKLTNDAFDHKAGDELIRDVADIFRDSTRRDDIIARWGGDEFVILLPRTSIGEAKKIKERINANCRDQEKVIPLSIALGLAVKDNVNQNIEEVLKEAEDRMYRKKLYESRSVKETILSSLKEVFFEKGYETPEHIDKLKELALKMGRALELSEMELKKLEDLVIFKDLGLVNISSEVYKKYCSQPDKLTDKEWKNIKKHTEISYHIAKSFDETASVAEDILSHHERWDGSGFPRQLVGNEIPLLSRIISIIDAYDRMMDCLNCNGESKEGVLKQIEEEAGKKFDPELVSVFLDIQSDSEL